MNLLPHIMKLDSDYNGVKIYECPVCGHRVAYCTNVRYVLYFGDISATHVINKDEVINQVDNGLDEIDRVIQERLGNEPEFRYINLSPIDEPPHPAEGTQEVINIPANDPKKFFEALSQQFKPSELEPDPKQANLMRKKERANERYNAVVGKLLRDTGLEDLL